MVFDFVMLYITCIYLKIHFHNSNQVEGAEYEELVRIHDSVYDQAVSWFTSLKDNMKAQILNHFGPMPGKEHEPQVNMHWYINAKNIQGTIVNAIVNNICK